MNTNNTQPTKGDFILVLDDERPVRSMVSRILSRNGYKVAGVETVSEAKEKLEEHPSALILCDIGLKDESGLDLLADVAPKSPDIAMVMMTGNSDIQTAVECLRAGAFDYLVKPMNVGQIEEVVSRVLERQRKMRIERDQMEEQLRMLGRFSSENPNPVLRVGIDGVLLYANPCQPPRSGRSGASCWNQVAQASPGPHRPGAHPGVLGFLRTRMLQPVFLVDRDANRGRGLCVSLRP